ncbi:MAG: DUF4832 domain-containing protein [Planctomycetes bacterium]|nr:DUF4832 domain-containing protein [Planctomycetota bacterium]
MRTVLALSLLLGVAALGAEEQPMITVAPKETDELLANPGIGWQTFHRTRTQDKSLPDWLPSTMHYARWGWGTLEPEPGKLDTAFLDKVLKESREAGQSLAFRVMCCSTTPRDPYFPKWLKDAGGKIIEAQHGDGPLLPIPDLDDPVVLERHLDFIKRLGERYDGHADIDHIDLGSVGWWGEWHMSSTKGASMPKPETQQKIVDAWLAAFKKTQLLMLIGGGKMLTYAAQHGAGWRADCLGDMGGFSKTWCHMRKGYPFWITQAGVGDAWKSAPVAWESCWDMRRWVQEKWPLRFIFNYALALHGSVLNNKSAPLPEGPEIRPEIERFVRRLGYRLVLKELKHPPNARAGGDLALSMKWQNVGSAPCYRPYRLAYRLSNHAGYSKVFPSTVTVNKWLPGSVPLFTEDFYKGEWDLPNGEVNAVSDKLPLPADTPPGRHRLSLAVIAPNGLTPAIRLAIHGRVEDGWYPLSELTVTK